MEHSKKLYIQPEIVIYELEDVCVNVRLDTSNGVSPEESDAKQGSWLIDDEIPEAATTTNEAGYDKSMPAQLFK